jgi:hypothetical protein
VKEEGPERGEVLEGEPSGKGGDFIVGEINFNEPCEIFNEIKVFKGCSTLGENQYLDLLGVLDRLQLLPDFFGTCHKCYVF